MSIIYAFDLPTISPLSLAGHIRFSSPSESSIKLVNAADADRALLQSLLKLNQKLNRNDLLRLVAALDSYCTSLFRLIQLLKEEGELNNGPISTLHSKWELPFRSIGLTSRLVDGKRSDINFIKYESGMVVLTYALALCSMAEYVVDFGSTTEDDVYQKVSTQKPGQDLRWKRSRTYLTKAGSMINYLIEKSSTVDSVCTRGNGVDTPVELQPSTLMVLKSMISGSLHLNLLYSYLHGDIAYSDGLLSRISIFVAGEYSRAAALLGTRQKTSTKVKDKVSFKNLSIRGRSKRGDNNDSSSEDDSSIFYPEDSNRHSSHLSSKTVGSPSASFSTGHGVTDDLRYWLTCAESYSMASAANFLARKSSKEKEIGKAIALCKLSLQHLDDASRRGSKIRALRRVQDSSIKSLKDRCEDLKKSVKRELASYEYENDHITFKKVEDLETAAKDWPSGMVVLDLRKEDWKPPINGFENVDESNTVHKANEGSYF